MNTQNVMDLSNQIKINRLNQTVKVNELLYLFRLKK